MELPEFNYKPSAASIYCINPEIKVGEIEDLILRARCCLGHCLQRQRRERC